MAGNKKNFPLRLDPQIHAAIERWAQDELRSVNSHIEFLLQQALYKSGRLPASVGKQPPNPDQCDDFLE
ncbi:MAG: Arc family DNA-binding protein [Syntrophomonadaceae bacterium]|nr:Arc family DNA-binding protein [Syntrophomonadaceae bacterium]